ncbi:MAG: hypothetical protein AAB368_03325, partial [bacterium]
MTDRGRWRGHAAALLLACLLPGAGRALEVQSVTLYTGSTATGPWTALVPTPPLTPVIVGDYIRIKTTLVNDDGLLGNLVADGFEPPAPAVTDRLTAVPGNWSTDNDGANGWWPGQYWLWPLAAAGCSTQLCEPTLCTQAGTPVGLSNSYAAYNNPGTPVSFVSADSTTAFNYNGYSYFFAAPNDETAEVNWVYRAEREWPSLEFFAYAQNFDDAGDVDVTSTNIDPCNAYECDLLGLPPGRFTGSNLCDCCGYSGFACTTDSFVFEGTFVDCGGVGCNQVSQGDATFPISPAYGLTSTATLDSLLNTYWAGGGKGTLKITAPVVSDSRLTVSSPGTRPLGVAYVGDVIRLETSVTNTAAVLLSVTATAFPRVPTTGGICYQAGNNSVVDACGRSALDPDSPAAVWPVPAGGVQTFVWSFTVAGKEPSCVAG